MMKIPMCMSPLPSPPGYQEISCSDMISIGALSRQVAMDSFMREGVRGAEGLSLLRHSHRLETHRVGSPRGLVSAIM